MSEAGPDPALPPLPTRERARGRRLAIASHPFGMTFAMVFTQPLPTLALLALGASETQVGVQMALINACLLLQLPTLRLVARVPKRRILVGAHALALLAALPLLAFPALARGGDASVALLAFAGVTAAISISNTVWFPLLRAYVEPDRIGRFFGTLRTGWHLTLIVYFLGSQAWLGGHPGSFAPLFGLAWALGLARIALIARLPERSERTGERIRIREAIALAREPGMRRYLLGVAWGRAAQATTLPFVVTAMRREVGFSDAQVVTTTVALFAGGLASLYLWGRAVDRVGAAPVFRFTALGMGALVLCLLGLGSAGPAALAALVAFFFAHAALWAGFGVADTHVLFQLTPTHAPSRALVLGAVCVGSIAGLAPALAGTLLDAALAGASDRLGVYRSFFAAMAVIQALAFLPLRRFRREAAAVPA
jgi:predicted MFS family arabinose efflux permease